MERILAVQGVWTVQNDVLTGALGQGFTWAYCLAGAETDSNYSVSASLKLVSGQRASVMAAFTYDANLNPTFIECLLDVQNQKLQVDLVTPTQRTTVSQKLFSLVAGSSYFVSVESGVASDGSGYVIFSVEGVEQIRIDDLSALFVAGMHGFGLWGSSATNSAVFSSVTWQSLAITQQQPSTIIQLSDVVAHLNASGPDSNNNYTVYGLTIAEAAFQAHVDFANLYINNLLGAAITSADPRYGSAKQAALDLACMRALVISMGGSMTGAFDYFLGDLRVSRAGPYAMAIKNTIEGLKEDFVRQLVNVSTVVKSADARAAGEVPTYRGGLISP